MRNRDRLWMGVLLFAGVMFAGGNGHCAEPERLDLPFIGEGDLAFFTDTAGFQASVGFTRQEIYVLLDASQLKFRRKRKRYEAEMELSVSLTDSGGVVVNEETWKRKVWVEDAEDVEGAGLPFRDMNRMTLSIRDLKEKKRAEAEGDRRVRNFEEPTLKSSDLLFASGLSRTDAAGRFSRYGWLVTPNVTRTYPAGGDVEVYFEIYHLSAPVEGADNTFLLGYSLLDTAGAVVAKFADQRLMKPGTSAVKTEIFNAGDLSPGRYFFQVEALDRSNRAVHRTRRMVSLARKREIVELTQEERDNIRYYRDIRYIARGSRWKEYRKLKNRMDQMEFLKVFWKELDPTPATDENERLIQHIHRMRFAENNYAAGRGKRGSDTDKGRIYIKFGEPSDIQYNLAASNEKPFEVWTYEEQRGVRFIFMDRRGAGVFELVHSTHPAETYNPNWRLIE
ncbi:MAG: GWxTD domain-containing protein [Candidatus Latescibacteria bacterium]|nr:GWxTD domain-containing protein [Candidatus Latescibacterota bacterium]